MKPLRAVHTLIFSNPGVALDEIYLMEDLPSDCEDYVAGVIITVYLFFNNVL